MEKMHPNLLSLKVAMVSYHNTLPFLYGLEKKGLFENLLLDIPSRCKAHFDKNESIDAALVPIGTLNKKDLSLVKTRYCIGCDGAVRTVVLLTNTSIDKVTKIFLDAHSRTSQKLTKILCEEYWKIKPTFQEVWIDHAPELKNGEAILMIGDKVFINEGRYAYSHDLGTAWKNMTGKSFPFAVWIFKNHVSEDLISSFENVLTMGIQNIMTVIKYYKNDIIGHTPLNYYTEYIDYEYNQEKKESLSIYLEISEILSV